jgi:hypothetical protein
VSASHERILHRLELGAEPFRGGLPLQSKTSSPSLVPTHVGEAKEVESLRLALPVIRTAFCGEPPKLNEPGLFGVQAQTELEHPVLKFLQELFGLVAVLESQDEVIRKTDDNNIAVCTSLSPVLNPEIQSVVEVHIREQR